MAHHWRSVGYSELIRCFHQVAWPSQYLAFQLCSGAGAALSLWFFSLCAFVVGVVKILYLTKMKEHDIIPLGIFHLKISQVTTKGLGNKKRSLLPWHALKAFHLVIICIQYAGPWQPKKQKVAKNSGTPRLQDIIPTHDSEKKKHLEFMNSTNAKKWTSV